MSQVTRTRHLQLSVCFLLLLLAGSAVRADQVSPPSQRLQQEFAASNDLRAFAMSAMSRPSEGGVFYATYAVNICGRDFATIEKLGNAALSKELGSQGTVTAARLSMMANLPQRCAGFIAGETSELNSQLKTRANSSGDPLVAAQQDVFSASRSGRPELLRAAVARAMELDDPLLWSEHRLWALVARADPDARKVSGFFLNGKVYDAADDQEHLEADTALELGFCKANLPCALDDELRMVCAVGGACAEDRYDKAKQMLLANGGTDDGWKKVMTLVSQIQAALARKDVSFFVR